MAEQPDLFPEDVQKAERLKKTDLVYRLKERKKSPRVPLTFRRLARIFREASEKEAAELKAERLKKALEDNI